MCPSVGVCGFDYNTEAEIASVKKFKLEVRMCMIGTR
jgi:hypothetical protein